MPPAQYAPKKLAQSAPATTAEATVYTVPGGKRVIIKQIIIANVTATAADAHLSIVPSGGAAGDSNRVFKDLSIPAIGMVVFDLSQVMESGDFISLKTDTANALTFTISGVETVAVSLPQAGLEVARGGVLIGTRARVNFIEGNGIFLTVADDAVNGEVDVTVTSAIGASETDPVVWMGGF